MLTPPGRAHNVVRNPGSTAGSSDTGGTTRRCQSCHPTRRDMPPRVLPLWSSRRTDDVNVNSWFVRNACLVDGISVRLPQRS